MITSGSIHTVGDASQEAYDDDDDDDESSVYLRSFVCLQLIGTTGSWPLTSSAESGTWSDASWDMEAALNSAYLYRSFPFFATFITVDDKNSSSYIVTVCMSDFYDLPYVIGQIIYIFILSFVLSTFFPRLISAVRDWMSAILHMVWP